MQQYRLGPHVVTLDEYVAYHVFEQARTEGEVTTYEVVDRLDPRQLESRIIAKDLVELADALAVRDNLRRKYATKMLLGVPV